MTRNSNINQLRTLLFEKSEKEYSEQTINGLFRSILEPLTEGDKEEKANVFLRLNKLNDFKSLIKRLTFANVQIYSFSQGMEEENIRNIEKENIWESVEFVLVLSSRYSAVMIWDYQSSETNGMSELCLLYNTRSISDIAKVIFSNSKVDFSQYLKDFKPDRRENTRLNSSIKKLAGTIEDLNKEIKIGSFSQNELNKTEKDLENYERANENIRFICHEIKNHLSIINLYSTISQKRLERVECDEETEKSLQGAIHNIQNSSAIIGKLLSDLKCFSKPDLKEIELLSCVKDTIEMARAKAKEKNVELNFNGEKIFVLADEMKLKNVLLNLIYNGIEAINKPGNVEISWEKSENFVQIFVKDTGEGILPEAAEKIFEMNFTTKESGNGLGLPICKTLMKEQNGELSLFMTGKKGTTFEILLPVKVI